MSWFRRKGKSQETLNAEEAARVEAETACVLKQFVDTFQTRDGYVPDRFERNMIEEALRQFLQMGDTP